ncbi:TOBE domain-containing protein [Halobacterium yunchengense]|uniref:TOBE domain-containing protein n=1 Tax=Halobacterium yunchengense TaxID=3108497 RepID=UPI00300874E6
MSEDAEAAEDGFEPHLAVGDVAVDGRDVEMLRAIDRHGSMQAAADALGRSYPHLQRRVVELEDAAGRLTERVRGGSGGGGTELTERATRLVRQFERLRVELGGVAAVAESVIPGTVVDRDGELATVETPAGDLTARVPGDDIGVPVDVLVRSDAVVVMTSDVDADGARTSLRNRLAGTVAAVDAGETVADVAVSVAEDVDVQAVVTAESRDRLGLEVGRDVVVAFKSTAARGVTPSL